MHSSPTAIVAAKRRGAAKAYARAWMCFTLEDRNRLLLVAGRLMDQADAQEARLMVQISVSQLSGEASSATKRESSSAL